MRLISIWEGPTVLAQLLRGALADRGIRSVLQATEPFMALIGEAAQAPFSSVLIDAEEQARRPEQVAECLALLAPDPEADEDYGVADDAV